MMTSNNALIPDPDKEDILASSPSDWPFLRLGLRMCGWGDQQLKYYLLGTPIIWWAGTASLAASLGVLAIYLIRMQRKYADMEPSEYIRQSLFRDWSLMSIQGNGIISSMWGRSHSLDGSYTIVSSLYAFCHYLSQPNFFLPSPLHDYGPSYLRPSLPSDLVLLRSHVCSPC